MKTLHTSKHYLAYNHEKAGLIMKTIKVSELSGAAIDWAVASIEENVPVAEFIELEKLPDTDYVWKYRYSTNWAQGGPIIEREGIAFSKSTASSQAWRAGMHGMAMTCYGPTPLISAMRCYVASKLGDYVEVPKELLC